MGGTGVLQFMGSQRVGHDWVTELNWTTLMAGSEEALKSLLMSVKEESERAGLKLKVKNTKIMTVCVLSQSVVSNSLQPMTVALQAPLSWGFSRQEYWSGLPCPPPGDILNPGIEPRSSELQANSLPSEPGKHQIMASGPITSWQIEGEKVEVVTDFLFWGCKITADGDCGHEIRRQLLLGRKVMINLDSVSKSRDILYRQMSIQSRLRSSQWSCMVVRAGL